MVKKNKTSRKSNRTTRSSKARKLRSSGARTRRSRTRGTKAKNRFFFSRKIWAWIGSLSFTLMVIGLLVLAKFASELPDVNKLESYDKPPGIRIYDSSNKMIGRYGHVVGKYIPYDEIPKHMIDALLATEDRRFFEHGGIDIWGIMRAMVRNIMAGGVVQGGSTITQQLAKNTFLTPERTLKRKIQEVMLSMWIEGHFSKEKIIEMYLNRVYLGGGSYGIDAAAHHYFDKSASDATLQESALLIGLLKAPSRYAPTRSKEASLQRTKQVILNMKDAEIIDDKTASKAIGMFPEMINLKKAAGNGSRYFADWVVDLIPRHIGQVTGDLEVYTTLNPTMQATAEKTVTQYLKQSGKSKHFSQAAVLTMTPDGAIKSMVGGKDYSESQFNRVTQAKRQPGSSFKLFVYLAALEWGLTPNSWVVDKPIKYNGYSPKNYNHRYAGDMMLREAFWRSINTVAVQLAHQVGIGKVINMAYRLGVKESLEPNLSLALGTSEVTVMEMVGAYAHMANNGRKVVPYAIRKITTNNGEKILYERTGKDAEGQVVRKSVVGMMNGMMVNTVAFGTGAAAKIGRQAAGKTGTSQNSRDAWFIGFTPQYVTGVWVGNDDNSPMKRVTGGSVPARIWRDVMNAAHRGKAVISIPTSVSSPVSLPWLTNNSDMENAPQQGLPWSLDERRRRHLPNRNNSGDVSGASSDIQLPTSQAR